MAEHYDRQGNRIDLYEWSRLYENREYRVVAADLIGHYTVSTVWLGINHNWSRQGPPIIFETMIFDLDNMVDYGFSDGPMPEALDEQWRYPTEEAALAGHDQAVMFAREQLVVAASGPRTGDDPQEQADQN